MQTSQHTLEHDRYQQGWEKLTEIDGDAGERVIQPERHRA